MATTDRPTTTKRTTADEASARRSGKPAAAAPGTVGLGLAHLGPAALTHRDAMRLQRTVGNRAVQRLMQGRLAPLTTSRATAGVVQRRGENPYAQAGSHEGWELTAHHIVAHSTLTGALKRLDPDQKKEVLKYAVPDTLTDTMLDNLKVVLPDDVDRGSERARIRDRLVGDDGDDETEYGIKLGDMRSSFFEWQGGNQFMGPNTSIRPEPSSSKDDIDYDGRYFTAMAGGNFDRLTGLGEQLPDIKDKGKLKDALKAILDLTKNVTPRAFAASDWTEIGTVEELEALAKDGRLKRPHMLGYSYFKASLADVGATKRYDKITNKSGDWFYETIKITVQVGHPYAYIPYESSKTIAPTTKAQQPLSQVLTGGTSVDGGANTEFALGGPLALTADKKPMLTIAGYPNDKVPIVSKTDTHVKVLTKLLTSKKVSTVTTGTSLFDYCKDGGMATSSYLPKALYETLQAKEQPVLPPVDVAPKEVGAMPEPLVSSPSSISEEPVRETPPEKELVAALVPETPVAKTPKKGGLNPDAEPFYPWWWKYGLNPDAPEFIPQSQRDKV